MIISQSVRHKSPRQSERGCTACRSDGGFEGKRNRVSGQGEEYAREEM